MNPFVRGSKNPFSSMKQVILEAQAVAAAAAKVADASSISLQISREDESQDSVHSLSPSSLPRSPSTRSNLNSNKVQQSNVKIEPTPKLTNVSAGPLQQDLYFPSNQVELGNSIDEHGLAGLCYLFRSSPCTADA